MNKIYSIVWSEARQGWVVARESASRHGKPSTTKRLASALLSGLISSTVYAAPPVPPPVNTLPAGGNVVAGQAGISQTSNTLNINQTTGKAIINWNSFSIGSNATVNFIQPNSASVTLNRVLGSDPSQIYGRLNANGQVFLLNPNGVLFGRGAKVDVAGLVATTLRLSDTDFMAGNYRFSGTGGSVINEGELIGKYIALLAPEVRNDGVIIARQGTVALAGSTGVTLNLVNNQLIDVLVDAADINTLVENKHLIQAEEGTVIMAAQSANHLLGKLVNSGSIAAQGISTDGGKVRLTASSNIEHSGSINVDAGANGKGGSAIVIANLDNANSRTDVSGSISAKGGSVSGDGGFVETSANHLKIADSARINTTAVNGKRGNWLLDPNDFIISAIGGDITGAALGSALDISNVTIQTTVGAASCTNAVCGTGIAGNGDIIFNDAVHWTTDGNVLTLDAYRNIVFNQSVVRDTGMFGIPGTAIEMTYGTSGTGAAYTTSTADWMTPFSDPFSAGNMFIQDNTAGGALTPAVILGAHTGLPLDLYLGAKNIPIFVNAVSGMSTYDGTAVPFLPTFSLDMPGAMPIDIIPTLTAGTPTFNTPDPTHAGTYAGVLYTGGLTSTAYDSLAAGNAAATWTIDPATLTVALTNTAGQKTKTYDGTNAAPVGFIPTYSFTGLVAGDTAATLSNTGATYNDFHVATANTLTVAGLAITGITGGNGSVAGDYVLAAMTAGAAATISPISLTAALTNVGTTKVYDGTTAAPGGFMPTYSFTGSFLAGDTAATLSNTGSAYNNAHVASANTITTSGLAITGITGVNSSAATDYTLTAATAGAAATITPVTLTATLNNVGTTKVYDGTTAAPTGFTPAYNLVGSAVGTDVLNFNGTFTYDNKNVVGAANIGTTNLSVAVSGGTFGSQSTDYQLTSATTSAAATITPATLSAIATGAKVDDGIDTIAGSLIRANGVNGEFFTFTGTGLLPDTLVDNRSTATDNLADVNDLVLDTANGLNGALASNYTIPAYAASTDFNITVTSVATNLTAVDIIQRTIAAQLEKATRGKNTTTTDFWRNINNQKGVTQDERDTVTQSVLKSVQKLCGANCVVDEDTVAQVLGGLAGCSAGFVLSGGRCAPEQKKASVVTPPTPPDDQTSKTTEPEPTPAPSSDVSNKPPQKVATPPDDQTSKTTEPEPTPAPSSDVSNKPPQKVATPPDDQTSKTTEPEPTPAPSSDVSNKPPQKVATPPDDQTSKTTEPEPTPAPSSDVSNKPPQKVATPPDDQTSKTTEPEPTPAPSSDVSNKPPQKVAAKLAEQIDLAEKRDAAKAKAAAEKAAADKKAEEEAAAKAKAEEEAAAQKKLDDEVAQKKLDDEVAQKKLDDAAAKKAEEEAAAKKAEEEAAAKKAEEEAAAKKAEEEAAAKKAEEEKAAADAAKVAANKLKLTNNVNALKQAATELDAKATKLKNQIDLAEKRDAAKAKADDARTGIFADDARTGIFADAAADAAAAAARSDGRYVIFAVIAAAAAANAADAAGAPTTPEELAKFKAALTEANDAAKAAKAAATANQSALDSTDPDLDVDAANKKADDDLDAANKALGKEPQLEQQFFQ